MKRIYLIIILTICTCNVLLDSKEASCFSFTWPGRGIKEMNCTSYNEKNPNIPCVKPILPSDEMPDTTELWNNMIMDQNHTCKMESGTVCVKYLYMYNKAVINASYFCGKVIEDQAIAVTSGCYVTYTEGYIIEACVCEDKGDGKPCNSTIRNTYSILIFFITTVPLFIYKMLNIP